MVWVVSYSYNSHGDRALIGGVFSTEEKAEKYSSTLPVWVIVTIEEVELDKGRL